MKAITLDRSKLTGSYACFHIPRYKLTGTHYQHVQIGKEWLMYMLACL